MPTISVLMPVYNGETYIDDTIKSVLGQTFTDFEFLIVDDGSTDGTISRIKAFSDLRIKIIQANHGGIVKALNLGIAAAQGEYIARIDADDICMPERFEKQYACMDKNRYIAVCGSWAETIDEKGEVIGEMKYPPAHHKDIKQYAILHNPFIHPSVMIRKSALDKVGPYRTFKHNEDYELWSRLLRVGEGHNISEKLIQYRLHANQVTKKNNLAMRLSGVYVRILVFVRLFLI